MIERREEQRVPKSIFVRFDMDAAEKRAQHGSFTQDISMSGMCLLSPVALDENAELFLNIDIPNDPDMAQAEASVRWVAAEPVSDENGNRRFPVGLEFTYLDRQDRVYLRDFLGTRPFK